MLTMNWRKAILRDGSQTLLLNNTPTFFYSKYFVLRQKHSYILNSEAGEEFSKIAFLSLY